MKYLRSLCLLVLSLFSATCFAADNFDVATNTLTIPLVNVNNTYYTNVIIKAGVVLSVGSQTATSLSYDTYNTQNNQLTIPEVLVGSTTYYNVVMTVGAIVSIGGECASLEACTSNSASSIYAPPAPYANAIQAS